MRKLDPVMVPPGLSINFREENMFFGYAVAAGRFNSDGFDDLVVGAPGDTAFGNRWAGSLFVWYGTANGQFDALPVGVRNQASGVEGNAFGYSLAVGRFNTDNIDDFVVGAPGDTDGASSAQGGSANEGGDRFGHAVGFVTLVGSSVQSPIVGAPGEVWSGASVGRAYVFRATGTSTTNGNSVGPSGAPRPPPPTASARGWSPGLRVHIARHGEAAVLAWKRLAGFTG